MFKEPLNECVQMNGTNINPSGGKYLKSQHFSGEHSDRYYV